MDDTEPQTAAAKVLWHFTMSLDGFVAGPGHAMDWMTGISFRPGLAGEYVQRHREVPEHLSARGLWLSVAHSSPPAIYLPGMTGHDNIAAPIARQRDGRAVPARARRPARPAPRR